MLVAWANSLQVAAFTLTECKVSICRVIVDYSFSHVSENGPSRTAICGLPSFSKFESVSLRFSENSLSSVKIAPLKKFSSMTFHCISAILTDSNLECSFSYGRLMVHSIRSVDSISTT